MRRRVAVSAPFGGAAARCDDLLTVRVAIGTQEGGCNLFSRPEERRDAAVPTGPARGSGNGVDAARAGTPEPCGERKPRRGRGCGVGSEGRCG